MQILYIKVFYSLLLQLFIFYYAHKSGTPPLWGFELKIEIEIDEPTFDELASDKKIKLNDLNKLCKQKLSSTPLKQKVTDLKKASQLIP